MNRLGCSSFRLAGCTGKSLLIIFCAFLFRVECEKKDKNKNSFDILLERERGSCITKLQLRT